MLGTDTHGRQYDYDGPYFPQYRPARTRTLHLNGRTWVKRMELVPLTVRRNGQTVTVQGDRHTVWAYSEHTGMSAVKHMIREVNAPRHPSR